MNKKGFTLVEILAVIVILGLVMVIVGTKGFGAFDKTKGKITELNQEAIVEGARLLGVDLDNCDDDLDSGEDGLLSILKDNIKDENNDYKINCEELKKQLEGDCIKTSVEFLNDNGYVSGSGIDEVNKDTKIKICKKSGKIVLYDEDGNILSGNVKNPYSGDKDSLAYNIINNVETSENGTELVVTPKTKVGEERIEYNAGQIKDVVNKSVFDNGPGFYAWYIGDTHEETKNSSTVPSSYAEAVDHYVRITYGDYHNGEIVFLDDYNESTGELTFVIDDIKVEKTLNVTADDYGTSYYYRGAVEDNYVNFAGMCWRIVRIDGEGNTKLVLEDKNSECDKSGYTGDWVIGTGTFGYNFISAEDSKTAYGIYVLNYLEPDIATEGSALNPMVKSFYNFQITLGEKINNLYPDKSIGDLLKAGNWCYNDTAYDDEISTNKINKQNYYDGTIFEGFYYDSYVRLIGKTEKIPTLKCNGTVMTKFKNVKGVSVETDMYVGTLTADEIIFSGTPTNSELCTFNNKCNTYLLYELESFVTLSPGNFIYNGQYTASGGVISAGTGGIASYQQNNSGNSVSFRPSINLRSGIIFDEGDGSKGDPYTVK